MIQIMAFLPMAHPEHADPPELWLLTITDRMPDGLIWKMAFGASIGDSILFEHHAMAVPLHRDRRGSAHSRGYGVRWRKARLRFLAEHPLCVMCERRGVISAAAIVDHIIPHKGDAALFWDENNWQGLCITDANSVKQAQERSGHLRGADVNGMPIDPSHHWHARGG